MKKIFLFFPVIYLLLMVNPLFSQVNTKGVCRIDEGRILFRFDLRWNLTQRMAIAHQFDLDSTLISKVYKGEQEVKIRETTWNVHKLDEYFIELSKLLDKTASTKVSGDDVILLDDRWVEISSVLERESVPYGRNKFTRFDVFQYWKGVATLFLPGYKNARKVYLSGTFNSWSRMETPMLHSDSGWVVSLSLRPGKYSYKYIIDDCWTPDTYNKLTEDDQNGGYNSVFFCYNKIFRLQDHEKAHSAILSGSFNGWNEGELRMINIRGSWTIDLYLREGTHAYKFIVDGNWINDPANKVTRPDGTGHRNSFISIGDTMIFVLNGFESAKKVILSGNFNVWNEQELSMEKVAGGWNLPYVLAAGNYEYKFIVDGKWIIDPKNPIITGSGNTRNSLLIVKPNHTFVLDQYPAAKTVILSGSFNGWNTSDYRMGRKDGKWTYPLNLKPGKYTYKFIVDGKWIIDPGNDLWEGNEYDNANSVLWIEP